MRIVFFYCFFRVTTIAAARIAIIAIPTAAYVTSAGMPPLSVMVVLWVVVTVVVVA